MNKGKENLQAHSGKIFQFHACVLPPNHRCHWDHWSKISSFNFTFCNRYSLCLSHKAHNKLYNRGCPTKSYPKSTFFFYQYVRV